MSRIRSARRVVVVGVALAGVLGGGVAPAWAEPTRRADVVPVAVPAHDITYDAGRDRLYASVPSYGGAQADRVVAIDPATGAVLESVHVGSDPGQLALSKDGSALYVGLLGAGSLVRIDPATMTVVDTTPLSISTRWYTGPASVEDMVVKADDADVVVASVFTRIEGHLGVIAIDNDTVLPVTAQVYPHPPARRLSEGPDANTFFGHNPEHSGFNVLRIALSPDGVRITEDLGAIVGYGFDHSIEYDDGRLFSTNGWVADPASRTMLGQYAVEGAVEPVASIDRTFILRYDGLYEFDRSTFAFLGKLPLSLPNYEPMELISTGDGLAGLFDSRQEFMTGPFQGGQVVLFPPSTRPPASFNDIAGDVHAANIVAVAEFGVAAGYPDGSFRPGAAVTRGQMASFLVRALDLPSTSTGSLSDIAGHTHEASIRSLAAWGITTGYPDGTFRPNSPVSREQMATFLVRGFEFPVAQWYAPFDDLVDSVHADAVDDLFAAGITGGTGGGLFSPRAPVSRGQMATFLARTLELAPPLAVSYD